MEILRFGAPSAQSFLGGAAAVKSSDGHRRRASRISAVAAPSAAKEESPVITLPANALGHHPNGLIIDLSNRSSAAAAAATPDGGADDVMTAEKYMREILLSNVYNVAVRTPLTKAEKLSKRGYNLYLKREDTQPVFSFKIRGAYNMISKLPLNELLQTGVITASAGNHAQGVAKSATDLGVKSTIYMPTNTPQIKMDAVRDLGGEVVPWGDSFDEAQAKAIEVSEADNIPFIPPFDHPDIIAGQGTVGMEIIQQMKDPIHAIFVPIGGGGLSAGIAVYVKTLLPDVKVIGVEPFDANSMSLSLEVGHRVELETVGTFADGVAVKLVGKENFRLCQELLDGVVLVTRDAIAGAIKDMFEETRCILEPSGALSIAGADAYCRAHNLTNVNVIAVTSGANMNFDTLRLVAEIANIGTGQEQRLMTSLSEDQKSLKELVDILSDVNISEISYRSNGGLPHNVVTYSVDSMSEEQLSYVINNLKAKDMPTMVINDNQFAKDHLNNVYGGGQLLKNEHIFKFALPEKPGALKKMLDGFPPGYNVTSLDFRSKGDFQGFVAVGVEVNENEKAKLYEKLKETGYPVQDESDNIAVKFVKATGDAASEVVKESGNAVSGVVRESGKTATKLLKGAVGLLPKLRW
ncbi:threonine dehydratase 1 biosynthetic, chloroplastic-like [Andrographis paniculata]|uniref:threonine dehydratase 1 biosynthetic, chloroplastic-like n=1 Tax=Andrographis paniculata TaxID=175694 RepID=UPI0021E8F535|nr:threonine dehydratase 1 biosynthetic, chloroplastic-like [Andrographis paniculata]